MDSLKLFRPSIVSFVLEEEQEGRQSGGHADGS